VDLLRQTLEWFEGHLGFTAFLILSWIALLVFSVWAVRHFLLTIPADYFTHEHQPLERWRDLHPVLRRILILGKNALGAMLVVAGIVMLFTPGQGVLSILLGVSLLDFPGKRAIERRIVQRPSVLRLVNAMRARANRPELRFSPPGQSPS
jgi:putative transmembrane protein PGPGW